MKDSLVVELGLKAAFEKAKANQDLDALHLSKVELEEYWFSIGFKMGHRFAQFVAEQKLSEKGDSNDSV
jgi:hypothetical protein